MKPKYNIGDEVWTILDREPRKLKITSATISENGSYYETDNNYSIPEQELFASELELRDALFPKLAGTNRHFHYEEDYVYVDPVDEFEMTEIQITVGGKTYTAKLKDNEQ